MAQVMIAVPTSTHALLVVVQLVPLGPVKPGLIEPCVVLGCQDYTIRVLERSTLIHQVQSTVPTSVCRLKSLVLCKSCHSVHCFCMWPQLLMMAPMLQTLSGCHSCVTLKSVVEYSQSSFVADHHQQTNKLSTRSFSQALYKVHTQDVNPTCAACTSLHSCAASWQELYVSSIAICPPSRRGMQADTPHRAVQHATLLTPGLSSLQFCFLRCRSMLRAL